MRSPNIIKMTRYPIMNQLFAAVILILSSTIASAQQSWSSPMADAAMARWPNGELTRGSEKLSEWAYDEHLLLMGITSVGASSGASKYFNYVQSAMDRLVSADGSIPSYRPEELSLDDIPLGHELLFLYERTKSEKYRKAAEAIRHQLDRQPRTKSGGFWHKKRYPNQMWLDGLYMAEPFYAEYAAKFGRREDFDDIAHQFTLIESHTRDTKTGLLYHAWDESKQQAWANKTTGTSPNFWARGMGWYAMALVDTLPYFPSDHPGRAQLIEILRRLAVASVKVQDSESGLWYQILDKPRAPGNYLESSASCMFVYALAKGVRLGYIKREYWVNAERGFRGIVRRMVERDSEGRLTVSHAVYSAGLGGTPYRDGSYEYYTRERVGSNDPKAIGAFLLASSEVDQEPTS